MSVRVFWDNPRKTIIRHTYKGSPSAEQYYEAIEETADLLATVSHDVDVILEFSSDILDRHSYLMTVASCGVCQFPASYTIIVAPRRALTEIGPETMHRLAQDSIIVDNLAHAYALIAHHRQQQATTG